MHPVFVVVHMGDFVLLELISCGRRDLKIQSRQSFVSINSTFTVYVHVAREKAGV